MNVYILDSNYNKLGYIDEADSILWNKKYNDIGECEVYVAASDLMFQYLKVGNYIYREDDDMICKIKSIEIETDEENGDYIIATGEDICTILTGRIVRWNITYSGIVFNFIKKLIEDNASNPTLTDGSVHQSRLINNLEFDSSNISDFTETINVNVFTDDLLHLIITTCKTFNYGFRITYDIERNKLIFRLYKGKNKATIESDEYVEFSPNYSNIISSNYKEDKTNYKNVVYVEYKNTRDETDLLSLYVGDEEPTGEDRQELYVDGTSTSRDITEAELFEMFGNVTYDTGKYYAFIGDKDVHVATVNGDKITVTDYTYLLLIKSIGRNALAEHNLTQSFTGAIDIIDTYKYKENYDLGDVVKIINEYGIEAEAQITSIMESEDNDKGYEVEPTFDYFKIVNVEDDTEDNVVEDTTPYLLTENGVALATENNELLVAEDSINDVSTFSVRATTSTTSKKISELEETKELYEGCCMPIVTNGETKKVTYGTLKTQVTKDIPALDEVDILSAIYEAEHPNEEE